MLALTAVALLFAATLATVRSTRVPAFTATDLGTGVPAPDFTLLSDGGERVSLSQFRGRAVLLFFGYTTCPDVCPLTLAKLGGVMDALGNARHDVQVLLVSVDPEVDTPDDVAAYARGFDPGFVGLTGSPDALRAVTREYGVYASEPTAPARRLEGHADHGDERAHGLPARLITHSSYIFGITRDGALRLMWSQDARAEDIAADVRDLLRL